MATFAKFFPYLINFMFSAFSLVKLIEDGDWSVNTCISPLSTFFKKEMPRLKLSSRFVPVSLGLSLLIALSNLCLSLVNSEIISEEELAEIAIILSH